MEELISVVIPAYNVDEYIRECVESVCRQTYRNIEIIIVDDGSTDNTHLICDELAKKDDRIVLLSQENQGVTVARGTGIQKAKGKYLAFVDADDWIDPMMLETMYQKIMDADLISVGVFHEKTRDCVVKVSDQFECGDYEKEMGLNYIYSNMVYDQNRKILQPMIPWIINKLYLRDKVCEVYKKVDRNLTFGEDAVFLYLYMLSSEKIIIDNGYYYHYRYRDDSAVHKEDRDLLFKIDQVYKNLYPVFEEYCEYDLLYQLQKWVQIVTCDSMSKRMGFDNRVYYPRFIADTGKLTGKRIILYGAGRAGQDMYRQLETFGYEIVLWVDKNPIIYRKRGFLVNPPEKINNCFFDVIYVAVEDGKMASVIRKDLVKMGVEKEKIIWNPLLKLY